MLSRKWIASYTGKPKPLCFPATPEISNDAIHPDIRPMNKPLHSRYPQLMLYLCFFVLIWLSLIRTNLSLTSSRRHPPLLPKNHDITIQKALTRVDQGIA